MHAEEKLRCRGRNIGMLFISTGSRGGKELNVTYSNNDRDQKKTEKEKRSRHNSTSAGKKAYQPWEGEE